MILPDQTTHYKSCVGLLLSATTIIILLVFTIYKVQTLTDAIDYSIQAIEVDGWFEEGEVFDQKENQFMIAAGLSAYDGGKNEDEIDPRYGELKFIVKTWGQGITGADGMAWRQIPTRPCKREDFNYQDDDEEQEQSYFFKLQDKKKIELSVYGRRLMCPRSLQQLTIYGTFDSAETANLMIAFEKC